jgi:spore coat polysaccharide biosynthesis protein SpsF
MIIAIVQARSKNTRLPGKNLLVIKGKTVLQHIYERLEKSWNINKIVIACPVGDKPIINLCEQKGYSYFEGDNEDCLDRFYKCALDNMASHIVRITADCPCVDYHLVDEVINAQIINNNDITTNAYIGEETYPDGLDVTVLTISTLYKCWKEAKGKHREHVVTYAMENPNKFKLQKIKNNINYSDIRVTLDHPDDFEVIKLLYERLYDIQPYFGMDEIILYYTCNPELKMTNIFRRDEKYHDKNI